MSYPALDINVPPVVALADACVYNILLVCLMHRPKKYVQREKFMCRSERMIIRNYYEKSRIKTVKEGVFDVYVEDLQVLCTIQ